MSEQRFRVSEERFASEVLFPLETTLLTATSEGAAETLGTIPERQLGQIARLAASNQTGSAASLTLYAIPDGGTIGASNREITALTVAGNTNLDLTDLVAGLYGPGTVFKAFASTGSALMVMGYVRGLL